MEQAQVKEDRHLAAHEERRLAEHESVTAGVRENVHAEIARDAARVTADEGGDAEALASSLRHKAVTQVATTEAELERSRRFARVSQIADYLFYLVYGLIGLEVALDALGARDSAPFKKFIDAVAAPFLAPFQALLPTPAIGRVRFMISYIVAIVVYMLLHAALNGLFRLFVQKKVVV
jgi:uncharacterized protein YggT (Ycf19 family)